MVRLAGMVRLARMDIAELVGQTLRRTTPERGLEGGTVDPQGLLVPSLATADDRIGMHKSQTGT